MSTESKQGQDLFRLNPHANINGTHLLARIACAPSCLVELFGSPAAADENKVSGMYRFESPSGDVFTVYDWKATTLHWGRGSGAPTPKRFWKENTPQDLMIGGDGKTSPEPFIKWLVEKWARHEMGLELLRTRLDASTQRLLALIRTTHLSEANLPVIVVRPRRRRATKASLKCKGMCQPQRSRRKPPEKPFRARCLRVQPSPRSRIWPH